MEIQGQCIESERESRDKGPMGTSENGAEEGQPTRGTNRVTGVEH